MQDFSAYRNPMFCNRFTALLIKDGECNLRFMAFRPAQNEAGTLLVLDTDGKELRPQQSPEEPIPGVLVDDQIVYMHFSTAVSLHQELGRLLKTFEERQKKDIGEEAQQER